MNLTLALPLHLTLALNLLPVPTLPLHLALTLHLTLRLSLLGRRLLG
ncbi:MAG: hypothetical protein R6U69_14575 [Marinobacter sp.]